MTSPLFPSTVPKKIVFTSDKQVVVLLAQAFL
jgi:hypothetical protein